MIPKKQKTRPFFLLTFLLISYVSGIKLIEIVNQKREEFKNYSTLFDQEIILSINKMNNQLSKLSSELTSSKNTRILRSNESKRIFQSYLDLGNIDSLRLYSFDCKNKQSYTLYERNIFSCKEKTISGVEWISHNDSPVLLVNKEVLINNQYYLLQGQLYINQTWLKKRNKLYDELQSNEIAIISEDISLDSKITELYVSKTRGKGSKPGLGTGDSLQGALSSLWTQKSKLNSNSLDLLFLIILALLVFILLKTKLVNGQNNKIFEDYHNWTKKALKLDHKDLYKLCISEDGNKESQQKNFLIKQAANLLIGFLDKSVKAQNKYSQLLIDLKQNEQKQKKYQKEMEIFSEQKSLIEEIKIYSPVLLQKLKNNINCLDDSKGILRDSASQSCAMVVSHLDEWHSQGKEIGYRKYLRSLSETKGNHEGISLLEEQVNFFKSNLSQVSGQINYCTEAIEQSYRNEKLLLEILKSWNMFLNKDQTLNELKVYEAIQTAKDLFFFRTNHKTFKIRINIDSKLSISSKESKAKLVSCFHHILSFCSEKKNCSEINISYKKTNSDNKILITCLGKNNNTLNKNRGDFLALSQDLLRVFKISQEFMDLDEDNLLICLSWNSKEIKIFKADEKINYGTLSLDH